MTTLWGNSSSISAVPVLAVETMRSREGMRVRYSSCSTMISFSTSWGVAPGQVVRTEITRASRSGIIWMGTLNMETTPNSVRMRMATVRITGFSMAKRSMMAARGQRPAWNGAESRSLSGAPGRRFSLPSSTTRSPTVSVPPRISTSSR